MSESFLKTHHISPANFLTILTEAAAGWRCSVRKGTLRNFLGKHLCQSLFLNKVAALRPATLLKKKTLTQVFSCEFCEISKNTFFHRTPLVAASGEITEITPKKVNAVKMKNLLEQPGSLP